MDNQLLADLVRTDLAYLKSNWQQMGRPIVTLPLLRTMLGELSSWEKSPMFRLLLEIKSGYTNGVRCKCRLYPIFLSNFLFFNILFLCLSLYFSFPFSLFLCHLIPHACSSLRVSMGPLSEFISTSHIVPLTFLGSGE